MNIVKHMLSCYTPAAVVLAGIKCRHSPRIPGMWHRVPCSHLSPSHLPNDSVSKAVVLTHQSHHPRIEGKL